MARLILTGEPQQGLSNFGTFEVTGTNGAETIFATQNAKATFDGSFNRGNDTINIDGNAGTYQIRLISSNTALITNATGASLTIPVGTGVTIKFNDADARILSFNSSGSAVLGTQALSGTGVTITPGNVVVPPPTGNEVFLRIGQDTPATTPGTAGNDLFVADIAQNNDGFQANTLGTGDRLDGLGGVDQLAATVQEAAALGSNTNNPSAAIAPITNSVEEIYVSALHANATNNGQTGRQSESRELNLGVQINARAMMGVTDLGSVDSDASLTFYNVNTLRSGASIGDDNGRITAAMTVRMDHSGPASPNDDAANLTVLFDNDYLLREAPTEAGSQLRLQLLDIDNQITLGQPLRTNPFDELRFTRTINGVVETFTIAYTPNNQLVGKAAYDALAASINAALDAQPALNGLDAVVTTVFSVVDPDGNPGGAAQGFNIVITNSGAGQLDAIGFLASGIVPPNTDYQKQVFVERPSLSTDLITVQVELEKVGRSGDGGYLTIGGMAQSTSTAQVRTLVDNSITNGEEIDETGVERFNVVVEGNAAQPSSLAGLQSTHNTLIYVQVTNPGSTASLTIGNTNTINNGTDFGGLSSARNSAVRDVLIFDASAFTANSTVWAHFSDETVAKYLNLVDSQGDARADNVDSPFTNARYSFGGGANVLNLNVSKSNVAYQGAITREDFELDIDMGAGNDTVQFQLGNGQESNAFDNNWFTNHVINEFRYVGGTAQGNDRYVDSQVNIYTQAGNDTVELWGSTAVHVELGDGDDVIYTDNSADSNGVSPTNADGVALAVQSDNNAVWVFNSVDDLSHGVNDLHSQTRGIWNLPSLGAGDATTGVNNIRLTVSFQDVTSSVFVSGFTGSNATGSVVSSSVSSGIRSLTDLQINQAIKDAVNNDPVLNKLLIARDGPSGTLIVESLIDGSHVNTDLQLALTSTTITAGQTGRALTAGEFTTIGFSSTTGLALGGTDAANDDDRWFSDFGLRNNLLAYTGVDSTNTNINVVEGGQGNDIIVLSSDSNSTETVDIDGVFTSLTGRDTLLNFSSTFTVTTTGGTPETQLLVIDPETGNTTGATTGSGTITFTDVNRDTAGTNLTIAPISFGPGTTLLALSTAVANAINAAPNNGGAVTATPNANGDVTLTYNNPGDIPQSTISITPTGTGTAEVNQIIISAPPTDVPAGPEPVNEGTAQVSFGGTTYAPVLIGVGEALDSVGARLAASVTGNATATYNAATDTITVTATAPGPVAQNVTIAYVSGPDTAGDPLAATVATETAGTPASATGVITGGTTPTAGTNPGTTFGGGYDIFDVTTVIGTVSATNTAFLNQGPNNPASTTYFGPEPDNTSAYVINEGTAIDVATLSTRGLAGTTNAIVITDKVSLSDYQAYSALLPAATAATPELTLIQAMVRASDNAVTLPNAGGSTTTYQGILITVDDQNVGTFYQVTNGAAVGDATVTFLGNIEMAQYDAAAKAQIGDWDMLSLTNFIPLTATSVITTYPVA